MENIIDNTWRSWAEGVNGSGIGESITFTFKTETPISGFYLRNGYRSLDYYLKNNRVKEFEIVIDNTRQIISIEDTPDLY
jgi:hypothetical protein